MNHKRTGLEWLANNLIKKVESKVEHHAVHHKLQTYFKHGFEKIKEEDKYLVLKRGYDIIIYYKEFNIADEYLVSKLMDKKWNQD